MKKAISIYGIVGVIFIFSSAVFRLFPYSLEAFGGSLSVMQIVITSVYLLLMLVGKGYFAMHRGFCPRAVNRAREVANNSSLSDKILAPLYCIGFFKAPKKRLIITYGMISLIIVFMITAKHIPQPWRGIVDAGPVLGLSVGILSLIFHSIRQQK